VEEWPPSLPNPQIGFATANLGLVLASCVPNALAKRAAEAFDLRKVRLWLVVLTLVGLVALVLRGIEYTQLNCRWDDNAYGSIVWVLLSLHTVHVATDVADGAVLTALMFIGPVTERRFVDTSENSLYWYFIVAWWIPIYLTIYVAPRWL
jgi:heme/copper-type cytochrome/quinol oxidase subunit 3